jgi:hypothetical protein
MAKQMEAGFSNSPSAGGGNGFGQEDTQAGSLLAQVDFKWLMAGQGCWVDSQRFEHDAAYADALLRQAQTSPCAPLRACAQQLAQTRKRNAPS